MMRQGSQDMAAYVILYTTEVTDEALHAEFRKRVGPLLQAKGGKYLLRGDISEVIGGELTSHSRMAVMEFETVEQARDWAGYSQLQGEYVALRELRDKAAKCISFIVESD